MGEEGGGRDTSLDYIIITITCIPCIFRTLIKQWNTIKNNCIIFPWQRWFFSYKAINNRTSATEVSDFGKNNTKTTPCQYCNKIFDRKSEFTVHIVLLPSLHVTLQNKFHFNASQNDEIDRTRCFMKQVVRFLPSTRVPSWGETFCSVPVGEKLIKCLECSKTRNKYIKNFSPLNDLSPPRDFILQIPL